MTEPQKKRLLEFQSAADLSDKIHLTKLIQESEYLGEAIEAALKEVEAAEALVAYLQRHPGLWVADYGVRLFYSYLRPPEENDGKG